MSTARPTGRPRGRHGGRRPRVRALDVLDRLDDVPVIGTLVDELGWAVVVLLVWGLSALTWHLSPWLFGALLLAVAGSTAWSWLRSPAPAWTVVPVVVAVALLQLAPVVILGPL